MDNPCINRHDCSNKKPQSKIASIHKRISEPLSLAHRVQVCIQIKNVKELPVVRECAWKQ